ncbi:tRNA (adenosine(37)-N6)-dimethylallyltransferase MiaA [Ponticoccus sp. SC2-23]|uniref:tRNA (adenosine(37)-N6)-dimethylallyltransferase MiaA n=1 Tax=Alexandriicola marinus TaxID=2081710 RepID=UPI000FD7FFEB|nr:tRNA (adenosine(37)-N6)-dimethylallyltransferase MiaA [Alexandriicola marinus]MBM1218925.1 tRNA (adenosine(37)-N6)-dimethylallyltransferase MiaA [Ponticoccus sp. SC6-9]MBM1224003.1 tRNA (adenosine(37)-N6)-dimethylallyltransferase MiaA [Ponticoccus sp. SC6-15]MBM1230218.1 tRNA (adenosine(37)-N6)-dimethylallyltransferase MiaA [Ponticoccus sp. SC6-38]MBM1232969.1 tRNA (adenosine(37)-N6)-dimethylallyltransferase MiaA [Ponticoccus sp. SC6-45]MBM1237081.1 tRNA (adenosine(37)-N6)-dimethylallyltran
MGTDEILETIDPDRPVLIAGPTASGKSGLALAIAERQGGIVINADALQVFDAWPILTAQPDAADRARAPHALYGHVPYDAPYSAGDWLRDLRPLLGGADRPIIVGGTGLYFVALTQGLAEIPPTPPAIRAEGDALPLTELVAALDPRSRAALDLNNRARVQRAWEVARNTGRPITDWQDETPPPALPLTQATALCLEAPPDWLTPRIEARFDAMLDHGAIDEARAMRPRWDPTHLSSRAIGAAELIAHIDGELTRDEVRDRAVIASRQYAKRQRTFFRARSAGWRMITAATL